jgi:hypothetical protein
MIFRGGGDASTYEEKANCNNSNNYDTTVVFPKDDDEPKTQFSIYQRRRRRRRQRIAVMFVGAPRTVTQTGVMTSHVVNIIDAIGAGGSDIVDVFFHMTNGTSDALYASNNQPDGLKQETFSEEILNRIMNLTSPVQVILHTDNGCTGLNGSIAHHSCCGSNLRGMPNKQLFNFLQFAFLRDSYRKVKQFERDHGVEYDWIVRARPDVACFEPIPAARSLSPRRYYLLTKEREEGVNTNDYMFIVPKNLTHSFFEEQIMTAFNSECDGGHAPNWPAEAYMFQMPPNLPYQVLPLPCVHVMSPYNAECSRLVRHDQPSIPTVYTVDGSLFDQGENFEKGCLRLVWEGYFADQSHV